MKFAGLKVGDKVVVINNMNRDIRHTLQKVTAVKRKYFEVGHGVYELESGRHKGEFSYTHVLSVSEFEELTRSKEAKTILEAEGIHLAYNVPPSTILRVFDALYPNGKPAPLRGRDAVDDTAPDDFDREVTDWSKP